MISETCSYAPLSTLHDSRPMNFKKTVSEPQLHKTQSVPELSGRRQSLGAISCTVHQASPVDPPCITVGARIQFSVCCVDPTTEPYNARLEIPPRLTFQIFVKLDAILTFF